MSFKIRCPHCQGELEVQEEWGGQIADCPYCQKEIRIPSPPKAQIKPLATPTRPSSGPFVFICPECGEPAELPGHMKDQQFVCPACGETVLAAPATTRICPYCQEEINIRAALCKFCKKKLPPLIRNHGQRNERTQSAGFGSRCMASGASMAAPDLLARIHSCAKCFFSVLISCGSTLLFGIFLACIIAAADEDAGGVTVLLVLFVCCGLGIWAAVEFFLLIFNCWKIIPPEEAETTPQKAVGFLFIPFFNLYWGFVAYYGLGKAMQRITGNSSAATWGLMLAIGTCAAGIPFVGGIFQLVALIGAVNAFQRQAKMILQG